MAVRKSLQTHLSTKKRAKVGGLIVVFVFYPAGRFLTMNNCLTERTGQTPLICEAEPSEL